MVKKWGNSASVRIPAAVLDAAKFKLDQPVDIREEGGRIIIEPARRYVHDLDELLDGIPEGTRFEEIDFGPPVGREQF